MSKNRPAKTSSIQGLTTVDIHLSNKPDETYPVQSITSIYDGNTDSIYIIAGSGYNPVNGVYEKMFVIPINKAAFKTLLQTSADFIQKIPDISKTPIFQQINDKVENLLNQLGKLTLGYLSYSINAVRMTISKELGGELIFYYISPGNIVDYNQGKIKKPTAEPILRFSLGIEDFFYFMDKIINNEIKIKDYEPLQLKEY